MKNLGLLLAFLCIANYLLAQGSSGLWALNELNDEVNAVKRGQTVSIAGSPYESEAISTGSFYLKDKRIIKKETKLNYYHTNFEFVDNGTTYLVEPTQIDSVIVNGATYVYRTFKMGGKNIPRIVKVIDRRGTNAVYFYKAVEFKPEVKAGAYIDPKPARFEWLDPVYLFEAGDKVFVLNNFKGLTTAFSGRENEIKQFIKENRIRKDKPDELKKLLEYVSDF
jgi:hypothetical protein